MVDIGVLLFMDVASAETDHNLGMDLVHTSIAFFGYPGAVESAALAGSHDVIALRVE